ncbi:hypothetical protein Tco_0950880 [Tanacetum coccineum]
MVAEMEPTTIQKAMQIAGSLTDEAIRNGSIKQNLDKRGNGGEPSVEPSDLGFSYEIEIDNGRSFDVIMVMDWLSDHRSEIIFYEKKQKEMVVVRDFPEVFPDDLSGLPPSQEIKFRIELVLGAIPVTKPSYRLAPSEMEELSRQLKEL